MLPCFLGHGEGMEMRNIFGWNCFLENEESGLVELIIRGFSRSEIAWVVRVETFLNNSPKISRTMIQMTFKAIDPRGKILIFHKLWRSTNMIHMRGGNRSSIGKWWFYIAKDATTISTTR